MPKTTKAMIHVLPYFIFEEEAEIYKFCFHFSYSFPNLNRSIIYFHTWRLDLSHCRVSILIQAISSVLGWCCSITVLLLEHKLWRHCCMKGKRPFLQQIFLSSFIIHQEMFLPVTWKLKKWLNCHAHGNLLNFKQDLTVIGGGCSHFSPNDAVEHLWE